MKLLILLFVSLITAASFGQGFKMLYSSSIADCFGAVEVFDYTVESHVQFPGNFGQRDDFVNMYPDFNEVNSVWLRLEPKLDGKFEFEIFTENNVDFSYFLFKSPSNDFCELLEKDMVKPLVYEMGSYYDKGIESDPRNKNFKPAIDTKYGDVFYLMIHTNSTYTGKVRVKYKRTGDIMVTKSVVQDFRENKDDQYLSVKIRDKETGEPVEANIIISGLNKDNALFMGTDFLFTSTRAKDLHIESNTQGYFLYVKDFVITKGPDGNSEIIVELERLAPGKQLLLEDIKFEQDSDEFLPIAMPALKRLLDFLALNDEIRIEIQGHVNAPGMENSNKVQKLSEKRAKAVEKFLKDNGIAADRIVVKGYGNTVPLYEKPKDWHEEEANRRVEILIIN